MQTALALLATVAVILLSGVMARRVIGQRMLRWFEALIQRIPLANTIYGSARQLLDILQTKPDGTQRVVLVDFPHTEMKSIGFVTRVIREQGTGRELAAVYVPTTPNPTSGYLEIVPVEKITPDRLDRRPGDELHHLRRRRRSGHHPVLGPPRPAPAARGRP